MLEMQECTLCSELSRILLAPGKLPDARSFTSDTRLHSFLPSRPLVNWSSTAVIVIANFLLSPSMYQSPQKMFDSNPWTTVTSAGFGLRSLEKQSGCATLWLCLWSQDLSEKPSAGLCDTPTQDLCPLPCWYLWGVNITRGPRHRKIGCTTPETKLRSHLLQTCCHFSLCGWRTGHR